MLLAGRALSDVDKIQPGIVALVRDPSAAHDDRAESECRLNGELRLLFWRGYGVVVDHILQHARHRQEVLRDTIERAFGCLVRLEAGNRALADRVGLGVVHIVRRRDNVEPLGCRLHRLGYVAAELVLSEELEAIERVRAIERVGCVVAVGVAVVEYDNASQPAAAVGR